MGIITWAWCSRWWPARPGPASDVLPAPSSPSPWETWLTGWAWSRHRRLRRRFGMIEAGSIHATISQADGMVRFDTNPESYSSSDMLRMLEEEVNLAMVLDKQVVTMEEEMMVSPAFVKKMAGVRGEEDEETGS